VHLYTYIHSPIRLHGVVLTELSTGTTLPFTIAWISDLAQELVAVSMPASHLRFVYSADNKSDGIPVCSHVWWPRVENNSRVSILNIWCYLETLGRIRSSGQSSWLRIQRSRVRFQELLNFLRSSGSGTGSTQPREDN
jgi:hypothetical protein